MDQEGCVEYEYMMRMHDDVDIELMILAAEHDNDSVLLYLVLHRWCCVMFCNEWRRM